jgi:hypothetical protein
MIFAGSFCLCGCLGTVPPVTSAAPATVAYVWGYNYPDYGGGNPQTVLEYSALTPQSSSSIGTLTLPVNPCNFGGSMAVDSEGLLYVACFTNKAAPQILVYAPNSTGTAAPLRSIQMSNAYYEILTLAVDAGGQLYVGALENSNSDGGIFAVVVYSAGASGPAVPLRTIQLPTNFGLTDVSVDASGNLYVAGYPEYDYGNTLPLSMVDVYSSTATGLATPTRTITFSSFISGVGVDAAGDVFVSAGGSNGNNTANIQEFAPDAQGYASPTNTISLANLPEEPAELGVRVGPVRFDAAGNMFTAVVLGNEETAPTFILYRFGPTLTNAVPIANTTPDVVNLGFAVN